MTFGIGKDRFSFSLINFKATRITYRNSSDDLCSLAWRRAVLLIIITIIIIINIIIINIITILFFSYRYIIVSVILINAKHLAYERRHT